MMSDWEEVLRSWREEFDGLGPDAAPRRTIHPLSGQSDDPGPGVEHLDRATALERLDAIEATADDARSRFLAAWRSWRDLLAEADPGWARVSAGSDVLDQTLWNRLDISAGLRAARGEAGDRAFLAFSLGPVQAFIEAAYTVRDLWTGSFLLSYLTFQAMRPVLDGLGPTAFVFPSLRGMPLMDRYLREPAQGVKIKPPHKDQLLLPCLPNRFVAVVHYGEQGSEARTLAQRCEEECRSAWSKLCNQVHRAIEQEITGPLGLTGGWTLWDPQVESFFEIRTAILPWPACNDAVITDLVGPIGGAGTAAESLGPFAGEEDERLYAGRLAVLAGSMEARRAVRHVPPYPPQRRTDADVPQKCTLLGSYEQMGPAQLDASRGYWKTFALGEIRGTRTRPRERLCAISLVKRFAWATALGAEFGSRSRARRFADTATIAARSWLLDDRNGPKIDPVEVLENRRRNWGDERNQHWSGQWLHWSSPDQEMDAGEPRVPEKVWDAIRKKRATQGPAPIYYAVLMLDGDRMGQWLRGELGPTLAQVLAPEVRADRDVDVIRRRPVLPSVHAAISEALANFALHFVPEIVREHQGELIYAGGDDVLALLPTATALACARKLAATFSQDWATDPADRARLLMGRLATVSAGLVMVHYKEDLRFALRSARQAEKFAKDGGRGALGLRILRRSGEHTTALLPWDLAQSLDDLVGRFLGRAGLSDRWAYALRAEEPTLRGLEDWGAVAAEVRRLAGRVEDESQRDWLRDWVGGFLGDYRQALTQDEVDPKRGRTDAEALDGFVTLCQSASFLARGRDR